MRILTIMGSPRKAGNTAHVLTWVEQTLKGSAYSVERVNLIDCQIGPCRECMACKKDSEGLCANHSDDANAVLAKIAKADVVLFAAPLFCWGFPSHLKALMDRMYCLAEDYTVNPEYKTRLENKRMALLMTCGGPEEGNAELAIRGFYAMLRFMKAIPVGHLLYPFFRTPADLSSLDKQRAVDFALKIVAAED